MSAKDKRKITVDGKGPDKADRDMDRRREDRPAEGGRRSADRAGDKGGGERPSVFSRLGNKVAGQGGQRGSSAGQTTSRGPSAGRKQGQIKKKL